MRSAVGFQKLLVYALIYIVGFVPESMLPKITSGLARLLFFLKTETAHVTFTNIKIFDPNLSEKAAQDMCLSSLSNSLTLIYELSKMRFSANIFAWIFLSEANHLENSAQNTKISHGDRSYETFYFSEFTAFGLLQNGP